VQSTAMGLIQIALRRDRIQSGQRRAEEFRNLEPQMARQFLRDPLRVRLFTAEEDKPAGKVDHRGADVRMIAILVNVPRGNPRR